MRLSCSISSRPWLSAESLVALGVWDGLGCRQSQPLSLVYPSVSVSSSQIEHFQRAKV